MTSQTNSSEHEPKLKVAYILKMFPRLSETFILNEILELERQNVGVDVFSLMPPGDGRFHGSLSELKLTIDFILREKPESYWDKLSKFSPGVVPHMDRWQNAANFLKEHSIPKDLDMLLRALFIGAKAKEKGIQHLHAHFATVSTRMAALVNILYDIPFSFTCHAKDIFRETVNRNLFRDLVDRSAFAITVSDFNRDYIIEKTPGVDATKIHRLYNGINLDFFEVPDDRSPLKASPIKLISVGRLVPKKGFDVLLKAIRILADEGLDLELNIIGDGDEQEKLQNIAHNLELDGHINFLGALAIEEVRRVCAESSMMALACVPDADGNMDALPTVLLEALALDLPAVSTTLTGCPEILGDGSGQLVEPGSAQAMADGIKTLHARILSEDWKIGTGRARSEDLFDLSKNVATLRGHFESSTKNNAQ
ncbi:MAG: glycosyltransferase [Planctomycetia bacterium]|nr:glycosyltransferase [Planctomycetia bacterium]